MARLGRGQPNRPIVLRNAQEVAGTQSASVAMSGAGTLAVTGVQDIPATVTLAGVGTMTVNGTVGSFTVTPSAIVVSAAKDPRAWRAALGMRVPNPPVILRSGGADQAGSINASVTMAGAGTLTATGTATIAAAVTMAGAGTLGVTPIVTVLATIAMAGAGAMNVTPTTTAGGAIPMSGAGTLTVTGTASIPAAITMAGGGTLAVTAVVAQLATVTMTGGGVMTVVGTSGEGHAPDVRRALAVIIPATRAEARLL